MSLESMCTAPAEQSPVSSRNLIAQSTPGIQEPPTTTAGILRKVGPGLIIAGGIVGSGELIATTKVGAQAGIALLWLILIGCLIKVFVQIELGRYTISYGETTLSALDKVPGPRLRVGWIVWYWLLMFLVGLGQIGGIVGGVGQALALAMPLTGDYRYAIQIPSQWELERYLKWEADLQAGGAELARRMPEEQQRIRRGHEMLAEQIKALGVRGDEALAKVRRGEMVKDPITWDDKFWSLAVAVVTIALLFRGRYSLVQNMATALVVLFTFITIGNVIALQSTEQWHTSLSQIIEGLSFRLRSRTGELTNPMATALSTFGIIGVGASELVAYPYWCLEKGYGRFTGARSPEESWAQRARGWMRVMRYDCWLSMVVYTIATLAFFLMGVAVLHSEGRDPDGMRMVSTLATAYVPVFGQYARWLFLVGAIAVLYSTFMVATAGYSRVLTDWFKVFGLMDRTNRKAHERSVSTLCVILPLITLGVYCTGANPVQMVLLGGTMQAVMLPMLGFAALYFRYRRSDDRLRPGRLWDVMLLLSCIGLLIAGAYAAYSRIEQALG